MNILVLSNTPWNNNNSFGNSFSNIFQGLSGLKFANIYCRVGDPDNDFEVCYFQITEKSLIKNLKNKDMPSGSCVIPYENKEQKLDDKELRSFNRASKMRWQIMFWGRNAIWKFGRWKSKQLLKFVDDFQPDIIFQPVYIKPYINEIALFLKNYTGAPMIGYISDDNYTLRQFNLSPLYWLDRLYNRRKVKAVIEKCDILYVISEIQKKEYERIFTPPCKILTKCENFSGPIPEWPLPRNEINLIYAGNIGTGRWKSLALISEAIEKLRQENFLITFDIYSSTPRTRHMKAALNKKGTKMHSPVSYEKIIDLEKKADIVVHVEGLSKKSRMEVHQSFSTKLVDFFRLGKCIFAIGTDDEASIYHLVKNDAAIVAKNKKEVYCKLKKIILYPEMILEYGKKAYLCGAANHDKTKMQEMLLQDMKKVIDGENSESCTN